MLVVQARAQASLELFQRGGTFVDGKGLEPRKLFGGKKGLHERNYTRWGARSGGAEDLSAGRDAILAPWHPRLKSSDPSAH